jgi:hypothetical protein
MGILPALLLSYLDQKTTCIALEECRNNVKVISRRFILDEQYYAL